MLAESPQPIVVEAGRLASQALPYILLRDHGCPPSIVKKRAPIVIEARFLEPKLTRNKTSKAPFPSTNTGGSPQSIFSLACGGRKNTRACSIQLRAGKASSYLTSTTTSTYRLQSFPLHSAIPLFPIQDDVQSTLSPRSSVSGSPSCSSSCRRSPIPRHPRCTLLRNSRRRCEAPGCSLRS